MKTGTAQLTLFGVLLRERDLGHRRFFTLYRKAAAELGIRDAHLTERQFNRWRRGQLRGLPRPDAREILAHLFPGRTVEALLAPPAAPLPDVHAGTGRDIAAGRTQDGPGHSREPSAPGEGDDDVHRRALLVGLVGGGVAFGLSSGALDAAARTRRQLDLSLRTSEVGEAALERWEQAASDYAQAYQSVPPHRLLADVMADFGELQHLLARRQTIADRTRLCRVTGRMAALTGIFMSALGADREARHWFHTGYTAASEAGDTRLAGTLAVRSAVVSLYYGTPHAARHQAASVGAMLPRTACPATTRALLVEARALARTGERKEALVRIHLAEEYFSRLEGDVLHDAALGYTRRQFDFHLGNAYTHLGMTDEAWQAQRRALAAYAPTEHLDPALVRLDRALCLARDGELDEAYRTAAHAWNALPPEHRTGMVRSYGSAFDRSAHRVAEVPAAREFRELLRA